MTEKENTTPLSAVAQKEKEILEFWNTHNIFEKSLQKDSPQGEFTFYDGPPFATGLPHYGHLLPGTIKDVIPRYKTMKGYHVRRQWGWDCHGLPIERLIQEKHGLKTKQDIEKFGVKQFNQAARTSVFKYDKEWKEIIPRTGRWVDMTNPYTTMSPEFTQSVWWGFGELYKKGLIYESFKVMHVSPLLETTLSNFEVNQGYKDITDISATVSFELINDPGTYVLAWTTTPWTLLGNAALAVGEDIMYVKVKHEDKTYVLASETVGKYFKDQDVKVIEELYGKELIGLAYKPVFDEYYNDSSLENHSNGWKIYSADFVTTTDGTGIVHIAPAFGEDDLNLGKKYNIPFIQHVKINGEIVDKIKELAGKQAKPKDDPQATDVEVIKLLAHRGLLFAKEKYTHSYPHCWRTGAPLLNYATSSWFIKVTDIKDNLVKNNNLIKWVPETVGTGRFGNWLKEAKDWAISRSRFWGTPIPIWKSEDSKEIKVITTIDEIKQKTSSHNSYWLIRHGQADHNIQNVASDSNDVLSRLTEEGRKQIDSIANSIKNKNIDLVYVSPLIRTQETAQIIKDILNLKEDQIIIDERIREVQTGFDGRSIYEYRSYFKDNLEKFEKKHDKGETLQHLKNRVGEFIYDIESKHSNKNILIVSHEYVIWMLHSIRDGLTPQQTVQIKEALEDFVETGTITSFEFAPIPHNENYELDFHRPYIDEITFVENGKKFTRTDSVFDTWIDSGAMPFASVNYPFSQDVFKPGSWLMKSKGFPADFIAEGLDQTRGWFYTLLVWSTALFNKPAFKQVVVNGLVLAEDGKKMAKSLNNYPPVDEIINKYGADSLRYFLLNSPAVKADDIRFSEKGVDEAMKKIILRLDNVVSFYEMYKDNIVQPTNASTHILDKWILNRLYQTIKITEQSLERYELDKASRPILDFVYDLSTWYLRRSRDRFKAQDNDTTDALATIRYVLREFSKTMAPIMPFKAEDVFLRTRTEDDEISVHLCSWAQHHSVDEGLINQMSEVRSIVTQALEIRTKEGIKVRQPLQTLEIASDIDLKYFEIIKEEVNVKDIQIKKDLKTNVGLDTSITKELKQEGDAREFIRLLQDLRKGNKLSPDDEINVLIVCDDLCKNILVTHMDMIKQVTRTNSIDFTSKVETEPVIMNEHKISIQIEKINNE